VGKPKHGDPRASYLLICLEHQPAAEVLYVPYDVAETVRAMREAGLPELLIRRIETGLA